MIHDSMYALGHLVVFLNVILHNSLLCGQQCPPSCYNIQKGKTSFNSLATHFLIATRKRSVIYLIQLTLQITVDLKKLNSAKTAYLHIPYISHNNI